MFDDLKSRFCIKTITAEKKIPTILKISNWLPALYKFSEPRTEHS